MFNLIDEKMDEKMNELIFANVKEPGFKEYDGIGIIFGVNYKNQYYVFYKRKDRPLLDEILSGDNIIILNKKDNNELIKNQNVNILIKETGEYLKKNTLSIPHGFKNLLFQEPSINIEKINLNILFLGAYMIEDVSICDKLMEFYNYKKERNEIHPGCFGTDDRGGIVDKDVKDSMDVSLSVLLEEKDNIYNNIAKKYFDLLQNCLECYKQEYIFSDSGQTYCINGGVNIQLYLQNGGYKKYHTERSSKTEPQGSRHLVFMTYLNDVTDRGETEFFYQKIKVKPKKGLTLIWPVDWTFTHRGIPSPTQDKMIVTGWFNFVDNF